MKHIPIKKEKGSMRIRSLLRNHWGLIALYLVVSSTHFLGCRDSSGLTDWEIGGDFELKSKDNSSWKFSEQAKDVNLVFFGYTTCPDYCPMTLLKFQKLNLLLGNKASRVQYIFISLDEKKDHPELLDRYVRFYVENGVGLTGEPNQIQSVVSSYKASFQRNGEYIDHSTYTYLVDKNLRTRYIFKHADPPEKLLEIINLLVK